MRDHQHHVVKTLLEPRKNLIFVAGTGSGKTISAIVAGMCSLNRGYVNGVIIVTPKGVQQQFTNEVDRLVPATHRKYFCVRTHHQFFNTRDDDAVADFPHVLRKKLLIVDEAHALSTRITGKKDHTGVMRITTGKMAHIATQAAQTAENVLLLTATPVKNEPSELFNLVCMVEQQPWEPFYKTHGGCRKELNGIYREYLKTGDRKLLDTYEQMSTTKSSFCSNYMALARSCVQFAKCTLEEFPEKIVRTVRLEMDADYLKLYEQAEQNIVNHELSHDTLFDAEKKNVFYSKVRVAVNGITKTMTSAKIRYTIDLIVQHPNRRVLVYSNFKDGGLSLIERELIKTNTAFLRIDGDVSASKRKSIADAFNSDDDPRNVLLISMAGSEGLDLKCVRDVVILEPHFHEVRIQQVIGRAVRFRSHITLPPEERTVTVHRLMLCKPKGFMNDIRDATITKLSSMRIFKGAAKTLYTLSRKPSVDELLQQMADRKEQFMEWHLGKIGALT